MAGQTPRAVLVGVRFRTAPASAPDPDSLTLEESVAELAELTRSAGAQVVLTSLQRRPRPDAATWIGAGKLDELRAAVASTDAELAIFDGELSPTQQRNLEAALDCRVLDRTQLILDIFALHARTREGQLQVELAQLEFLLPRLAGHGRELSRLGGGIGTRGPGETKLETDRRRIHQRMRSLREALEQVRRQRGEQRRQRESVPLDLVALVGYTNAGKSTLFNRLTGAGVLTSARMFATLDPTIRTLALPSGRKALVSDTVGFIRNLPHGLVSAFRATLEEVSRARLLLVVVDANAQHRKAQMAQVEQVLRELGAESTPRIPVWNKADLLTADAATGLAGEAGAGLLVSARTGAGLEHLRGAIEQALPAAGLPTVRLLVPETALRLVHVLHERGEVLAERYQARGVELVARIPAALQAQFRPYLIHD